MKKTMLFAFTALMLSVACIMEAKEFRFWVFGSGTAQDSDRASAVSQATDSATQQINAGCIGTVETVEQTGTTCLGGNNETPYTCLVFAKGLCKVNR
jgi:hypothetical protein